MLLIVLPSSAQVLEGEIKYSVNDAKIELQHNRPSTADYLLTKNNFYDSEYNKNYSALLKGKTNLNDKILALFSDGTYAINYKNDLKHVWYYDKNGALINIEVRTSLDFPYGSYKYDPDGELVNMSLKVSKDETFIFSPLGQLLGHWIGEKCYDENGIVIMTRKIMK